MATYNTAFGALPSTESLTGVKRPRQKDEEPRDFLQQRRAQQQAQRQQPAPAQTFAQMQAAGQARPAPPMLAPAQGMGGPMATTTTRTPLLQQLEQQLQPAAAAPPMAAPPMTAPAMAAPAIAAPAPAAPAPTAPPMLDALRQTMGGGRFGLGAISNLISEEDLIEQQGGRGGGGMGGYTPTTVSVITTAAPPTTAVFTTEAPTTAPPVETTRPVVTPPTSLRVQTTPPPIDLATTVPPTTGAPTTGAPTTTGGPGATGAPGTTRVPVATTTTARVTTSRTPVTIPTFAPVTRGAVPTFAPSAGVTDLQAQIRQVLTQMQAAPSPFESEAYRAQLAASEAELGAQYGAQRSALEEQLARQGLSASSIGAGRYGDLAGQQARALAGMRADLLKEAANQQAERQQVLLQGMTSLSGQMGQQEIQKYQADINAYQTSGQLELDSRRLQQDAAFRGVELTLEEARDIQLQNYQTQVLENQLKEITARERQASASILAALIPNLDLSALSDEQLKAIFSQFGLSPEMFRKSGEPTTTSSPTGNQTKGDPNAVETLIDFPVSLADYPEGKRFSIQGKTYTRRGNTLVDEVGNVIRSYQPGASFLSESVTETGTGTGQTGSRSYNTLTPDAITALVRQSPSLQAMNARLAGLPAAQQTQYIRAEQLPDAFLQGQAVPDEAMPGTVYYNYNPQNPVYMAYDGVGFRPLTLRVEEYPPGSGRRGNVYRLPDGTRWA